MIKTQRIVRILLALMMLIPIFKETGFWTTLAFFLIFIALESQDVINRRGY